jgi:hypothetical protein
MLRISVALVTLLLFLNGCAPFTNTSQERFPTLNQQYSQFDAKIAWNISSDNNATIIEGVAKNVRYFLMDDFEVWVWALDEKGKEISRGSSFVFSMKENEAAPFTVTLPKLAAGTKLRFMYRYISHDGGAESGAGNRWSQSFDSETPRT